jgi:NADH:ubiquinone oxidoreductase subunit 5 (subunit L)/multisubunit Na+/H+ antiporter MnhA subunit
VEGEFLVRLAADPIKDKPIENIFRITDEIVHQLNRTKKLIILMIVSIVVVLPATHIISFALIGDTIFDDGNERPPFDRSSGPPDSPGFRIVQAVVIGTVLFWLGIGIRQWFVFSKWTKKYKQYKELQKNIDEKLKDDDISDNDKERGEQSQ